jgi:parallel beta-helix repeat protein
MPDQEPGEVGRPLPEPSFPVVYVDPVIGNDRAIGSESQPLKTITQALKTVQAGAIIQLRPGLYSAESEEVFPLIVKPGVTLRGDVQVEGRGIQITGGGRFFSPTWVGQNVAVVAEGDARIEGVSMTNSNSRGTAIWIEAGAPIIEHNTLRGSDREAIFVSGNAAPKIRSNIIEQNGANGISFTRDSSGVADGNMIRNSEFGVVITERATPRLVKNQITQNKDGVVMSGTTQPLLRYNAIENNLRDGIVMTSSAEPTLKQNTFNGNGQYDVHNTTRQPVKVEEAQLADLKVKGKVDEGGW